MSEKIYSALAAVNRGIDAIGKLSVNQQQGFQYRGIDDAYNALHDLLAEHGIVTMPRVLSFDVSERASAQGKALFTTRLMVEYDFIAEDGSKITAGPVLGEGFDSGDKGANKALAVAHKYVLFQTFTIPTMFSDPDAETHEVQAEPVLMHEDQQVELSDLNDYLPEVTKEWIKDHWGTITSKQAERILDKAREAYAEAAKPTPKKKVSKKTVEK